MALLISCVRSQGCSGALSLQQYSAVSLYWHSLTQYSQTMLLYAKPLVYDRCEDRSACLVSCCCCHESRIRSFAVALGATTVASQHCCCSARAYAVLSSPPGLSTKRQPSNGHHPHLCEQGMCVWSKQCLLAGSAVGNACFFAMLLMLYARQGAHSHVPSSLLANKKRQFWCFQAVHLCPRCCCRYLPTFCPGPTFPYCVA